MVVFHCHAVEAVKAFSGPVKYVESDDLLTMVEASEKHP